jgi:dTDP-4-dehydrorhamnose 3,5-epimerase
VIFRETELPGCYVVEPERHEDERGFFARTFASGEFESRGLNPCVAESSISFNGPSGTLRGLHYQTAPHAEAKLVRCTRGRVFDVAVDLRRRRWTAVELSAQNRLSLYIPEGFAHGFLTLEPESELSYLISVPYAPGSSAGLRWDDPALGITWPNVPTLTISERDRALPRLAPTPPT